MSDREEAVKRFEGLLGTQPLAVLASDRGGQPYTSLVAFASLEGGRRLLFATTRATRKYENLMENGKVSLMLDDRSNRASDFREAAAATVLGVADEVVNEVDKERLARLYIDKHPHLEEFLRSPTCALFMVNVKVVYLVSRFQDVMEIDFST